MHRSFCWFCHAVAHLIINVIYKLLTLNSVKYFFTILLLGTHLQRLKFAMQKCKFYNCKYFVRMKNLINAHGESSPCKFDPSKPVRT